MIIGEKVTMVESGVDACASDTTASGETVWADLVKRRSAPATLQQQMPCRTVVSHPGLSTGLKLHISTSAAEMKQSHLLSQPHRR